MPTPADGSASSTPLKYVFFVSDGVGDRVNGSPGCPQPVTNRHERAVQEGRRAGAPDKMRAAGSTWLPNPEPAATISP